MWAHLKRAHLLFIAVNRPKFAPQRPNAHLLTLKSALGMKLVKVDLIPKKGALQILENIR